MVATPGGVGRRPTIHDVARSAAVSPATVSNVLTGRRHVDPELASRVLSSIETWAIGVTSPPRRCAARSGPWSARSCPSSAIPFFAEMVDRLEREARARRPAPAGRHQRRRPGRGDAPGRGADRLAAGRHHRRALRRHVRRARGAGARGHPVRRRSTGRSTMAARSTRSPSTMSPPPMRAPQRLLAHGPPPAAGGRIGDHDRQHPRARGRHRHGDRRRAGRAGRADRGRLRGRRDRRRR